MSNIIHNYIANKELGQNFIFNPNITDKICSFANNIEASNVIEIGPGTGALTKSIVRKKPLSLLTIEKDSRFIPMIEDLKDEYSNLQILNGDALIFDWANVQPNTILMSNLPYNITSEIFLKWIYNPTCKQYLVTIQKEYGQKITSQPGDKNYCSMGVLLQTFFDLKKLFIISKKAFTPPPKVDGMVVSLKPKNITLEDKKGYLAFINKCFSSPRKKLSNNLPKSTILDTEKALSLLEKRPDNISCIEYEMLYKEILKNNSSGS